MHMSKYIIIAGMALLVIVATGCQSASSAFTDCLRKDVARQSGGYLELSSVAKDDAVEATSGGIPVYEVRYTATVKCTREDGGIQVTDGKILELDVRPTQCQMQQVGQQSLESCRNTVTAVGDTYQYSGRMVLVKHEQGWVEE